MTGPASLSLVEEPRVSPTTVAGTDSGHSRTDFNLVDKLVLEGSANVWRTMTLMISLPRQIEKKARGSKETAQHCDGALRTIPLLSTSIIS